MFCNVSEKPADSNVLFWTIYRIRTRQMLTGHLREDGVKVSLVLVVDESIVKDALTLVTEQTEDLRLISHCRWLTLQHTCAHA